MERSTVLGLMYGQSGTTTPHRMHKKAQIWSILLANGRTQMEFKFRKRWYVVRAFSDTRSTRGGLLFYRRSQIEKGVAKALDPGSSLDNELVDYLSSTVYKDY